MKKPSLLLALALALGIGCTVALAQAGNSNGVSLASGTSAGLDPTLKSALTPEFLETKIKETDSATDLEETAKSRLTEQYRKALSALEAASALETKAAAFKQALETAPGQAQAIREKLESPDTARPADLQGLSGDAGVTEIEQRLTKTQADAAAVTTKLSEIQKELEASATRPAEARQAIVDTRRELDALEAEIELPPPEGESAALTDARRWALVARRQALRSQILMLDQELLSQGVRVELLKATRDKAAADLKRLKEAEQALQEKLNEKLKTKAADAAQKAEAAQRRAANKPELVQDLARRNADLSEELTSLTARLNDLSGAQEGIEEQTRRIEEDFRSARQRLEAAGLTQALGQVLFDQRKRLPDLRSYRRAAAKREESIAETTLSQIRNDEELRRLQDPDSFVGEIMAGQVVAEDRASVETELRKLVEQRRTLLAQVTETGTAYLRVLGDLDYASSQLMEVAENYDDFLSERLLWVRNAPPVSLATFGNLPTALFWAINPANWVEVVQVLFHEATHSIVLWLLLLTVALLEWKARSMRRHIRAISEHLRRIRTDNIRYTFEALGLTLLVAAPLPMLLTSLGWRLSASLEATDFSKAIGQAAVSVSLGLYYLRSFRVLCMPGGVADRHFRWSQEVLTLLRRNFDWLLAVLVPLGFFASAAYSFPDEIYSGSLGRLSLIALMVGLAVFFALVLHPRRGALRDFMAKHPNSWLSRLRNLWYPLVVAEPLALALLTAVGYLYMGKIVVGSLASTMYLVLGVVVVHQLAVRWLVLTRRRLALQVTLDRRTARAAELGGRKEEVGGAPEQSEASQELDLASLDEQTRRLLNTLLVIGAAVAFLAIWSQVLPAFGILEDVALWHYQGTVEGKVSTIPVSVADIGLVMIIALLSIVAAKNVPALLEILLLSRTELSSGSRYTIKTLTGYAIVAVAALVAFSTLGLSWDQVQWLVAALGLGIGFGLQEIVANFISGIIILFERPVRVGDVVTIGDITGTVSKIRIRATTIRNWDKQELLVPNKEFITGRLLNWTLSDTLNRILITVGVDYGADVPKALALLEEAAREQERVLDDPAPLITFEGFGDNALDLVLRCYLDSLDNRLATISQLHQSINEKFQAAGISIAFPQRDVHLSTAKPLDVRVRERSPEPAEPLVSDASDPLTDASNPRWPSSHDDT